MTEMSPLWSEKRSTGLILSAFVLFALVTQGSRWRSNPGLKLANAFGVFWRRPRM